MPFKDIDVWNSANDGQAVESDQGYTFYWDRQDGPLADDDWVEVSLVKANVVQMPRTLGTADPDPNSSRNVPVDGNIKKEENGEFLRNEDGYPLSPDQPGYSEQWKKNVVEDAGKNLKMPKEEAH